jgi:hypothetical protein
MCQQYLRDVLTDEDPGGTWTYVGYNQTSSSGPWENTPAVPLVTTPIGGTMTGDNPLINPLNKTAGYYRFKYTVLTPVTDGFCTDEAFVTVHVVDRTCAGNVNTKTVCTGTPVNIIQELQVGSSCTVTAGTITPSFPNNIFTPTSPGTTVFTNTVDVIPDAGFDLLCTNCNTSATLTVNVVPNYTSGVATNVLTSICQACPTTNLSGLLSQGTNFSPNGIWVLQSGGPLTFAVNNITATYQNGDTISTGVSTVVNFTGSPTNSVYTFRYIVNVGLPCEQFTDVQVGYYPTPNAGVSSTETWCSGPFLANNPNDINLFNLLGPNATTNGTWSYRVFRSNGQEFNLSNSFSMPNFSEGLSTPTDNTIILPEFVLNFLSLGLHRFEATYRASNPGTSLCVSCGEKTAVVTRIIEASFGTPDSPYTASNPYVYVRPSSNLGSIPFNIRSLWPGFISQFGVRFTGEVPYSPPVEIVNLIRYSDGTNNPQPQATYPLNTVVATAYTNNSFVNFDFVPAGKYQFETNDIATPSCPGIFINDAWIEIVDAPPACNIQVSINSNA